MLLSFPTREELAQKPNKMEYPNFQGDYKFYGKSIPSIDRQTHRTRRWRRKELLIEVIIITWRNLIMCTTKEHEQDEGNLPSFKGTIRKQIRPSLVLSRKTEFITLPTRIKTKKQP